jgi:hypothetical protein
MASLEQLLPGRYALTPSHDCSPRYKALSQTTSSPDKHLNNLEIALRHVSYAASINGSILNHAIPRRSLKATESKRELLRGWEVVLFTSYFAVVLGGHLEQFQMAICGCEPTLVAQALHLGRLKKLEVNRDTEVLIEDFHAIDTADCGAPVGRMKSSGSLSNAMP